MILHTYYQSPGGEDLVVATETSLLQRKGHQVASLTFHNRRLDSMAVWRQTTVTLWNAQAYHEVRKLAFEVKPDIIHIHNTFPLASPAAVHAARAAQVPVVMTLHNYRLLCPVSLFFRDGRVWEACLGKAVPWPGVLHGCWRGRLPSAVVAAMLSLHRCLRTWDKVSIYIALTEFARRKFIAGGLPADKIVVKPNVVDPDPGVGMNAGGYALFVGRLSPEKGVDTLLAAWQRLQGKIPLKIVGDGPLAEKVRQAAQQLAGVEWLGYQNISSVYALMKNASFLVFPSKVYEGFPRVIVEAFACGLPILSTCLGSQGSLIDHGRTGLLFRPKDPDDLTAKVEWLLAHPVELTRMQQAARREYEERYAVEVNYQQLVAIYEQAISLERSGSG
ncbi:glycosyltransferase family 4 protein [uncultured Chloroflexus sp.]|uniref:glycosyltransferase family 4 protein n=1 Tax=uncultured Chloroflexus sp. TaxID=214040 RepID=UPI00260B6540|nr:glycosyltransferase family 4 protein [uncultured Chloroflexus sp.]